MFESKETSGIGICIGIGKGLCVELAMMRLEWRMRSLFFFVRDVR